jgi:hypothetical protein
MTRKPDFDPPGESDNFGRLFGYAGGGQQYYAKSGVPRTIPAGHVLAHNWVDHTRMQPHGKYGFRCGIWSEDRVPAHFEPCGCGWAGLPHVAMSAVITLDQRMKVLAEMRG